MKKTICDLCGMDITVPAKMIEREQHKFVGKSMTITVERSVSLSIRDYGRLKTVKASKVAKPDICQNCWDLITVDKVENIKWEGERLDRRAVVPKVTQVCDDCGETLCEHGTCNNCDECEKCDEENEDDE